MGQMVPGREDAIDIVYIDGTHDSRKGSIIDKVCIDWTHDSREGRSNRISINRWDT